MAEHRHREAAAEYATASELFRAAGQEAVAVGCRGGEATARASAGQFAEAERAFMATFEGFIRLNMIERAGHAMHGLCMVYRETGRFTQAEQGITALRGAFAVLGNDIAVALCNYNLGGLYWTMGRYAEAEKVLLLAERFRARAGEGAFAAADIDQDLAHVYISQGRHDEGEQLLLGCIQRHIANGDERRVATCSLALAGSYMATGRPQIAVRVLTDAMRTYRTLNMAHETAMCTANLGQAHTLLGQYELAERALLEGRDALFHIGDRAQALVAGISLGTLYLHSGRYPESEDWLLRMREESVALGLDKYSSGCLINLGYLYAETKRFADAEQVLLPARELERKLGNENHIADCSVALGGAYTSLRRFDDAEAAVRDALEIYERLGIADRFAACVANLGFVYVPAGRFAEAEKQFERAAELLGALDLPDRMARIDLGRAAAMFFRAMAMPADAPERPDLLAAALRTMIPAFLYLDGTRFQFDRAALRSSWNGTLRDATARLFTMAAAAGDARLVADLIEYTLNAGVYTMPRETGAEQFAIDLDGISPWSPLSGTAVPMADASEPHPEPVSGAGTLIAGATLPMAQPPPLLMPDGRRALASYSALMAARYGGSPDTRDPLPVC